MQNFTKASVKQFRADFEATMAAFGAKHGLTLNIGNIRFTPNDVRFKVTGVITKATAVNGVAIPVKSVAEQNFVSMAWRHGLQATDLHKKVTIQGREFEITGYMPGRPKFSFEIRATKTGRQFKATRLQLVSALGR